MFNFYEFEKRMKQKEENEKLLRIKLKRQSLQKIQNDKLTQNYKQRVGSFINKIINDNLVQVDKEQQQLRRSSPVNEYYNNFQIFQNSNLNQDFKTIESNRKNYEIKIDKLTNRNHFNNSESIYQNNQNNSTLQSSRLQTQQISTRGYQNQSKFSDDPNVSYFYDVKSSPRTQQLHIFDAQKRINSFRFQSNQRERVLMAQDKNSILDSSPSKMHEGQTAEKIMKLRPRIIEKEIGPPSFKFKATSTLHQIVDVLQKNPPLHIIKNEIFSPNIVNNKTGQFSNRLKIPSTSLSNERNIQTADDSLIYNQLKEKSIHFDGQGQKISQRGNNKTQNEKIKDLNDKIKINLSNKIKNSPRFLKPKNLLPNLHQKTHYKAAVEYTLGDEITHRSLHDKNNEIEQMLYDNYQKKQIENNQKFIKQQQQKYLNSQYQNTDRSREDKNSARSLKQILNQSTQDYNQQNDPLQEKSLFYIKDEQEQKYDQSQNLNPLQIKILQADQRPPKTTENSVYQGMFKQNQAREPFTASFINKRISLPINSQNQSNQYRVNADFSVLQQSQDESSTYRKRPGVSEKRQQQIDERKSFNARIITKQLLRTIQQ